MRKLPRRWRLSLQAWGDWGNFCWIVGFTFAFIWSVLMKPKCIGALFGEASASCGNLLFDINYEIKHVHELNGSFAGSLLIEALCWKQVRMYGPNRCFKNNESSEGVSVWRNLKNVIKVFPVWYIDTIFVNQTTSHQATCYLQCKNRNSQPFTSKNLKVTNIRGWTGKKSHCASYQQKKVFLNLWLKHLEWIGIILKTSSILINHSLLLLLVWTRHVHF